MKNLYIILSLFFVSVLLPSCNGEDDFKGTDKAIASFKLIKNGKEYLGCIKNNTVTISLPENESLYEAVAKVEISENAIMIPDPSTIVNWDEEFRFSIKAYNGESTTFTYIPVFTPIISETGDIYLTSQADVDAFVLKNDFPSIIDGNLIIGKTKGSVASDTITDISRLGRIKEIRNALIINPTCSDPNLSYFNKLEKVGGIEIKSTKLIKTIKFESLKSIQNDFTAASSSLQILSMPKLIKVSGTFTVGANVLTQFEVPLLETVGGNFSMASGTNSTITHLDLSNLKTIGGQFILSYYSKIKSCNLDKLETCAKGIDINFMSGFEELEFPSLISCGTTLKVYNSGAISILSFPVLKEAGTIDIATLTSLISLRFDELETVSGDFKLQSWRSPLLYKLVLSKLKKVTGNVDFITTHGSNYYTIEEIRMPALEEVGGNIKFYVGYAPAPNTSLKTLDFSSLVKAGKIDISNQSVLSDFSTFKKLIPNISSTQWSVTGCKNNPKYDEM